jgi:hypothetical protein
VRGRYAHERRAVGPGGTGPRTFLVTVAHDGGGANRPQAVATAARSSALEVLDDVADSPRHSPGAKSGVPL